MWGSIATKLAIFALKSARLPVKDRNLLTACILDRLAALPLRDIIHVNEEGNLLVNGRPVDVETARQLRESARGALTSTAFKFIRQQVAFQAINIGVHKAEDELQMFFGRAAIWWGQQEEIQLRLLAQMTPEEDRDLTP